MATARYRPWRVILILAVLLVGLFAWAFWPGQSHTPRLGLDLKGGTQVILTPKPISGQGQITDVALKQSVEIIRQRVNGFGVAEAEVTTQGSGNNAAIVVSVPGVNQQQIADQLKQTALLDFRAVETIVEPGPTTPPAKPYTAKPPVQAAKADDPALQQALAELDCTNPANHQGGIPDDPTKWIVTCDKEGQAKYLLQPAFLRGTNVTDASATLPQNGGGGWQVDLTFDTEGAKALATTSSKLVTQSPPQNQFGIVLDGLVQSSPVFQQAILGGQAQITGKFTVEQARDLANVLKYGALPITLEVAEVSSVSPTLGTDQLQAGLIAGAIGLALVGLYLLAYYRLLGLVAVFSLVLAAAITYASFVVLGRTIGLALTLAGVAGAIVSIGITADSFIVYFERIRDEIRDGRSLRTAADTGWARARHTILAADFVSLLAAVILYFISVGNVRGFAFTLGLTTLVDVLIAFMFTRPLVSILSRNRWFASGHPMTGLDPRRLGVKQDPGEASRRKPTREEAESVTGG